MNQEKTISLTETQLNSMLENNAKSIHDYYLSVLSEKERALADVSLGMKRLSDMYNAAVEHIHKLEAEQKNSERTELPVQPTPAPESVDEKEKSNKQKRKG